MHTYTYMDNTYTCELEYKDNGQTHMTILAALLSVNIFVAHWVVNRYINSTETVITTVDYLPVEL